MHDKLVTICIPLYNCENTISKTLDSLINQSYKNIKIKIFDNQSTDKSGEIAREYAEKNENIYYELNHKNLGGEGNFTKCILNAEGDYTAIFHSDDIYTPTMVSAQVAAFIDEDVSAVCSHAYEINEDDEKIGERLVPNIFNHELNVIEKDNLRKIVYRFANFITCPSVMVRSDLYKNYIQYWNIDEYGTSADLDVWLRLNRIGKIVYIRKPLMGYRVASESYSYRIAKVRTARHDIFKILDKERDLSQEDIENINFLEFKDITYRTINIIRSPKYDLKYPDFTFNWQIYIRKLFDSSWHFKIFLAGLFIFCLRPLPILFFKKFFRGRDE